MALGIILVCLGGLYSIVGVILFAFSFDELAEDLPERRAGKMLILIGAISLIIGGIIITWLT